MHPKQIPLTAMTDPASFPQWQDRAPPGMSGHPYPKMLTRPFTKEDREPWKDKHRQMDINTRQEFFIERCPRIGDPVPVTATQELVDEGYVTNLNDPIICQNAEDEKTILLLMKNEAWLQGKVPAPDVAAIVSIPVTESPAARLKRENDELEAELERNQRLKSAKKEVAQEKKKKGWPKGKPRGKRVLTAEEFAAGED